MVRMMALGGAVVAFALGCSTQYPADGGDDDAPDGGVGSDDGGTGSGSGSGDGLAIELIPTTIKDERGDKINFTSNAPVHTHDGPAITLGGADCPTVYKYSYLLDPQAPVYGSELTPNPLVFEFSTRNAKGAIASAEYQVLDANNNALGSWTPATPTADGRFAVQLYRSGASGISALNSVAGQYKIQFRVSDGEGNTAASEACWNHNPLAAPIKFTGLAPSTDADGLKSFSFAKDSPISRLINADANNAVKVFEGLITHQTAEPVVLKFDISKPTVGYTKTAVVDRLFWQDRGHISCGVRCQPNKPFCVEEKVDDPHCNTTTQVYDPVDAPQSGTVATGQWSVKVYKGGVVATQCSVSGQTATCALPGRGKGDVAHELNVVVHASGLSELRPGAGTVVEYGFWYLTFTGFPVVETEDLFKCTDFNVEDADETGAIYTHCDAWDVFPKLRALDKLRLDISSATMNIATAVPAADGQPASALAAPPYLPNGNVPGMPLVWDAGDDDLPGPQH